MIRSAPSARRSYCAEQVRAHDRDRYLCTLVAPPDAREGLFALYAFDVEIARVRQVVREPAAGLIRLQWWREALEGLDAGRPLGHPVVAALHEVWPRLGAARAGLYRALEGRERELDDEPPADLDALERHLDATSASITLAALDLLDARDEASRAAGRGIAIARGIAELVRAVPADVARGRALLPGAATGGDQGLRRAVEAAAVRARAQLQSARALRAETAPAALPALLPGALAERYLRRLRRAGFDPYHPRPRRPQALVPLEVVWRRWRTTY